MPRIANETVQKTCLYLKQIKVFTIGQVASLLHCSIPSARLKLKQWNAYTSYNHNGRFYTLPTVPSFDPHGLWRWQGIYFSKHGNLKATVMRVVTDSISGLSGKQLGNILGLSPQSFLHHCRDMSGLGREKHGGVYVYFSATPARYQEQVQQRVKGASVAESSLSDADAVLLLVARLQHPLMSLDDLLCLPEIQAKTWSADGIRAFLHRHGLLKKTLTTRR